MARAWLARDLPTRVRDTWQLRLERLGKKLVEQEALLNALRVALEETMAAVGTAEIPLTGAYIRFQIAGNGDSIWLAGDLDVVDRRAKVTEVFGERIKNADSAIQVLSATIEQIQTRLAPPPEPVVETISVQDLHSEKLNLLARLAEIDSLLQAAGVLTSK